MVKQVEQHHVVSALRIKVEGMYIHMLAESIAKVRELIRQVLSIFESLSDEQKIDKHVMFYVKLSEAMSVYAQSMKADMLLKKRVIIETALSDARKCFDDQLCCEARFFANVTSLLAKLIVEKMFYLMLSRDEHGSVNKVRELAKFVTVIFQLCSFEKKVKFHAKLSEAMVVVYAQSIGPNSVMNKKVKIEVALNQAKECFDHDVEFFNKVSELIDKLIKDREELVF